MPFSPLDDNLQTLDELISFTSTVTYVNVLGSSFPVTITTNMPHPTILVSGNTISGLYDGVFTGNTISYRTKQRGFATTNSWLDIDSAISSISQIYLYEADKTPEKVYVYTASANGESKTYTITVTNNWSYGIEKLQFYLNLTRQIYIPPIVIVGGVPIRWINRERNIITWTNANGDPVGWITS